MVSAARSQDVIELSAESTDDGMDEIHTFHLRVPADLEYFEGHFDGEPIVAAVVQLDVIILPRIEAAWPDLGSVERATKMKFRSPIRAEAILTLRLSRKKGQRSVGVGMIKNGIECASGTLFFREVPS